jgi:APA family basic amino acid/polyamine antiporter
MASSATLVRGLGLVGAASMLVCNVIGTGVFLKARVMTCNVGAPAMVMAVWVTAGLLSLAGALTYAELAVAMPRSGGEYVFLREAYGRPLAFLYGWMRFFVGNSGGIAALAAGFAIFLNGVSGGALSGGGIPAVAIAVIVLVTMVNCAAVSVGGRVAATLTVLKAALILGVGLGGFLLARGDWGHFAATGGAGACEGVEAAARGGAAGFAAAMLGALWAYNGWNETTYVAGEVKEPQRNLPLAIVGGLLVVAALYVFVNASYFYVLSPAQVAGVPASSAVSTAAIAAFLGPEAARLMAAAMAVSVFGALQAASLVMARVPHAMAQDGLFFRFLATVSPRTRVPVRALFAQAAWAIVLVLSGTFDQLTDYAMFSVLIFVALTTASVFLLRRRGGPATSYRTWGYPVTPALFLLVALWLIVNTLQTSPRQALAGLGLMALGAPFYFYWSRRRDTIAASAPGPGRTEA